MKLDDLTPDRGDVEEVAGRPFAEPWSCEDHGGSEVRVVDYRGTFNQSLNGAAAPHIRGIMRVETCTACERRRVQFRHEPTQ